MGVGHTLKFMSKFFLRKVLLGMLVKTLQSILALLYKSTEIYCCHFDVSMGSGVCVSLLKFYVKVFLCYGQGTVRCSVL